MYNQMRAIHPGEILKEELETLGCSANEFAKRLHVPANRVTSIMHGQRAITADTALRLAQFFGTTPELWLNLQTAYDLKVETARSGEKIQKEIERRHAA